MAKALLYDLDLELTQALTAMGQQPLRAKRLERSLSAIL